MSEILAQQEENSSRRKARWKHKLAASSLSGYLGGTDTYSASLRSEGWRPIVLKALDAYKVFAKSPQMRQVYLSPCVAIQ